MDHSKEKRPGAGGEGAWDAKKNTATTTHESACVRASALGASMASETLSRMRLSFLGARRLEFACELVIHDLVNVPYSASLFCKWKSGHKAGGAAGSISATGQTPIREPVDNVVTWEFRDTFRATLGVSPRDNALFHLPLRISVRQVRSMGPERMRSSPPRTVWTARKCADGAGGSAQGGRGGDRSGRVCAHAVRTWGAKGWRGEHRAGSGRARDFSRRSRGVLCFPSAIGTRRSLFRCGCGKWKETLCGARPAP
jgi:hypothetical protein